MTEQVIHRDPQFTEELLNSAKAGDRDALAALYEGTHQEIYRTIHAMVRDEDLTMDIQQDSYIHAFTHLDQLRNASSFLPWLRRVAVNEARMQLRKKKPLLFTEYVSEEGEEPETFMITINEGEELDSGIPFSLTIYAGAKFY